MDNPNLTLHLINKLKIITKSLPLVDAHRHSLYDLEVIRGLDGVPVENWTNLAEFVLYQKKSKSLFQNDLFYAVKDWLNFSLDEGVKTILDFSAKHAREDLNSIYSEHSIKSFSPLKWSDISNIDNLKLKPDYVILPDEKGLSVQLIEDMVSFSSNFPNIKFTMHCLESVEKRLLAENKFGGSTIEWLYNNNFLNERLLLVHVNEISEKDVELIRDTKVRIVLCPLMRKPLQYNSPKIPLDIPMYFGTDAPLISGSRSIYDVAVKQIIDWINHGVDVELAINSAFKALTRNL